jgi:2-keto-4-pentenoate hydratase/2-oxohepta-3-ene-1,7-dioic acid hydratase in catechol pathway
MHPSKIVCVGRNYAAHAKELGNALPERPLLFFKPPSSIIADGAPIVLPVESRQVEHEAEIGLVIGTRIRNADARAARAAISALVPANDVTARDLQKTDDQWARAKGFDTFCPLGTPYPIAADFDLTSLEIVGRVNGTVRQHGKARDMVFSMPTLVAYISSIMTLEPGDVILTGTPDGVGPLAPGDSVTIEIPGIGTVTNPVQGS